MLKKENRLSVISGQFKKRISTPLFNISITSNSQDKSKFAFVVSKKVDRRATERNRIKRRARSIIEESLSKILQGKDIAFYLKKESAEATREDFRGEIEKVFKKNNIYK